MINAQHMGTLWMLRLDRPLPDACVSHLPAIFLSSVAKVASDRNVDKEAEFAGELTSGLDSDRDAMIASELALVMGFDDDEPVLQRFRLGKRCSVARLAGRIVAYGWMTFDEELIGGLGLRVRLLPGEAYIWDCGTLLKYRGQHLYPALLSHIQRELQSAGLWRAWIGMDADNLASQAGVRRAGFQPIVDILQANNTPARTLLARGCPGAASEDVQAAQYALFGDREVQGITLADIDG